MDYDNDDNCVTFMWKIYNFSHCTQKTRECLRSPSFFVNEGEFSVDLYPRGTRNTPDSIGFGLYRRCVGYQVNILCAFSISTGTGSFQNSDVRKFYFTFTEFCNETSLLSLTLPAIHKRRIVHSVSDGDTLTFKCKIVKVEYPGKCVPVNYKKIFNAFTVIDVEKTTCRWDNTFINLKHHKFDTKKINLCDGTSFSIDVSWVNSDQDLIEILIRRTQADFQRLHFSSCTLSLLDTERVLQSVRHEYWFEKEPEREHVWNISFAPKIQLMSYPQQDTFFCLEFGVSKGIETSGISEIQHGTSIEHQPSLNHPSISTQTPTEFSKYWKNNLQRFYADGTLSDVTIRTPTKEFPVHKALLCAQSEVFTAMFEQNMKEKETGIIDIDDSNDETISKMLLYIYGDSVENLDWESALNLYSAAHKYRIAALCEQCLDFLKDHLSKQNFYECLHLADLYQDQLLKSVVQEFVKKYSMEVINSEEWTEFMRVNVNLAAETMRMCFKN